MHSNHWNSQDPAGDTAGYRGIWFTLGHRYEYGDKYSGGLGTYTANHVPMAAYSTEANKTFFTYGGGFTPDQRQIVIMAGCYDHATHQVQRPVAVHMDPGVDDPHDNASIHIAEDGHVWIIKSGRGPSRPGVFYRSKERLSIEAFDLIDSFEMTYPQVWPHPGGGVFLLFTKYTNGRELYWKTGGLGRPWSDDQLLAGFGGHYQVSGHRKGRYATFFNYHPGGDLDQRTNLYFAQTIDGGQNWTTVDGRLLDLPLRSAQNDALVLDLQSQGLLMFPCDMNFDAEGNPVLLFITSRYAGPGPAGDPREWRMSRWTGSEWVTSGITSASHNYDMGSLYTEADIWRIIAPTGPGPQPGGTGGEMALWTSSDKGATWELKHAITTASEFNHSYARRPAAACDPFYAFWADGHADCPSESRLYFTDSTGRKVWQLPYTMSSTSESPIAYDVVSMAH